MSKWYRCAAGGYGEMMKDRHGREVLYFHHGIMVPEEDGPIKAGVCNYDDGSAALFYYDVLIMFRTKDGDLYKDWDPDVAGYLRDGKKHIGWSQIIGKAIKNFCGLTKSGYYNLPWFIRTIS